MTFTEQILKSLTKKSKGIDWSFEEVQIKGNPTFVVVAKHKDTGEEIGVALGTNPEKKSKNITVNTLLALAQGQFNKDAE